MRPTIYYLPGSGGQLHTGLGEALRARGCDLAGRETRGEFRMLPFSAQVATIAGDLQNHFWCTDAKVIANSFGAYLFLHAQATLPPFPGEVILLSPITGSFEDGGNGDRSTHFVPPCADRLLELIATGTMPAPRQVEIHTGELDWQSPPASAKRLGDAFGVAPQIVPGAGHMLPKPYVAALLDRWLG